MIKILTVTDQEEACSLLVSIDTDYTGALVYGTNQHGDRVSMLFDVSLLKHFFDEASKAIKVHPAEHNECGEVTCTHFKEEMNHA